MTLLQESFPELERAVNSAEWSQLTAAYENDFTRAGLRAVVKLARIMYLKNPLIKRGVQVKANYVFGRGVTATATDEIINDVIQRFMTDENNQAELTGHIEQVDAEIALELDGNLFFVLFPHVQTGHIRIGTIPFDDITEIICNPSNPRQVWLYKREYDRREFNLETGIETQKHVIEYFKDWLYTTDQATIGGNVIRHDCVIRHLKVGGLRHGVFGIPEVYAALDWAKAYKGFLEDFATLMKALSRYAWQIKTTGGARGVASAHTKLNTTLSTSNGESNPPANAGSTVIGTDAFSLNPIKTAGSTTSAEDGRPILLMVASALGLPESFFGNVQGTYATAHTLDRPTELAFVNRQQLWASVYDRLLTFVLKHAVIAPDGPLRGIARVEINEYGEDTIIFDESVDTHIDIDFPNVLERNTNEYIDAIIKVATLDGKTATIIHDKRLLTRMLLTALGEDDIDQLVDLLFPEGMEEETEEIETPVTETLKELREVIVKIGDHIAQAV